MVFGNFGFENSFQGSGEEDESTKKVFVEDYYNRGERKEAATEDAVESPHEGGKDDKEWTEFDHGGIIYYVDFCWVRLNGCCV